MKKTLAVTLLLCLLFLPLTPALTANAAEANTVTLTNVPDVSHFIQEPEPEGELHIAPAAIVSANGTEEVWFVSVRGIDWLMRGVNNFLTYIIVSFNGGNRYLTLAKNAILQNVPAGAKIVLAGHSLGGMIVQQLICDDEITAKYEVVNALTFGSPYVVVDEGKREGKLYRMEDKYDTVPKFSIALFMSPANYRGGIKRGSPYLGDPNGAHNNSYKRTDIWGAFDALGHENGGAKLVLNADAMVTLKA